MIVQGCSGKMNFWCIFTFQIFPSKHASWSCLFCFSMLFRGISHSPNCSPRVLVLGCISGMPPSTKTLRKGDCHGAVNAIHHPIGTTTSSHPHRLTFTDNTSFGWLLTGDHHDHRCPLRLSTRKIDESVLEGQMGVQQRPTGVVPNSYQSMVFPKKSNVNVPVFFVGCIPSSHLSQVLRFSAALWFYHLSILILYYFI